MEILSEKIIAIVRGIEKDNIIKTVQALFDGGISSIEIALNHKDIKGVEESIEMVSMVHAEFGKMIHLGAGTVLTKEEVELVSSAGAEYIISPNINEEVIRLTKYLGKISIPGALTPTEVMQAYSYGADIVKVFPAGALGMNYAKALMGPLGFIPLAAVGGVDLKNAKELLSAGYEMLGIGDNLVNKQLVKNGEFGKITELAQAFVLTLKD